ncbi:ferredoxin [Haloarcula sp. S1CR25-12]|uniref:Ferredoxin n=1 Tax=Haloarcula saliterrae TaxID=2950534 RepID=A0ABU2FG92_9EURY|nr:ferredoxin [Haloarcula sp. S1CR25-12]MDS0261266.1 ferredoxin [Haloarcula sp. S1CR25-12]
MYTISIDRDACDGVFACLVRDDRFVEDADGLAAIEVDDAAAVSATFDDDRRADAEGAAAACPLDAITVTDADAESDAVTDAGEGQP